MDLSTGDSRVDKQRLRRFAFSLSISVRNVMIEVASGLWLCARSRLFSSGVRPA